MKFDPSSPVLAKCLRILAWVIAHVDAAQEHHVLDVLLGPFAHHGQYAQSVAIVEHVGDVLDDGQVGAARAAGHDRHHVFVHARAKALARGLSGDGDFVGL